MFIFLGIGGVVVLGAGAIGGGLHPMKLTLI